MSNAKGDRRERELVNALDERGFAVMRAPASGSATDRDLPDVLAGDGETFYAIEAKSSAGAPIYLDGAATQWPTESERRSGHPFTEGFAEARERDLVVGACAFCANAFGATESCQEAEIELLGAAGEQHGPDVAAIVDDGYELLTVG